MLLLFKMQDFKIFKNLGWQRSFCPISWQAEWQKINGDAQIYAVSEECMLWNAFKIQVHLFSTFSRPVWLT